MQCLQTNVFLLSYQFLLVIVIIIFGNTLYSDYLPLIVHGR